MRTRPDGALVPAAATIAVCTQPASTGSTPCSPLATLYTDATLATPCTGTLKDGSVAGATNCSNPLITDAKGNYHFYATTSTYTLQTYGSGITTSSEPDVVVPLTSSGSNAFALLNGIYYPSLCGASPVPSWCSGSDIGGWANAAITALGARYGKVKIPCGVYPFSTQINADLSSGLVIEGDAGVTNGAAACVEMIWTGTGTPISARSSAGFRLQGIQLLWNNAGFAGTIVDLSHTGTGCGGGGCDTAKAEIDHNYFGSTGSGGNAAVIINLDKVITSHIHDSTFSNYVVGLRGFATGGSYSNEIFIDHNNFSTSTGTAVTAHIKDPGQAWDISTNTFEQGAAIGQPAVILCTLSNTAAGVQFAGNWIGDDNGGTAHNWFTGCAFAGTSFSGNYFGGTTTTTLLNLANQSIVFFTGNTLQGSFATVFNLSTNVRFHVGVNSYGGATISTFMTGSPFTGYVYDNTDTTTFYGQDTFIGNATTFKNSADAEQDVYIQPGSTADQLGCYSFKDKAGTIQMKMCKNASNRFDLIDINGNVLIESGNATNASTHVGGTGTGKVFFNELPNSGSSGVGFGSGGASPSEVAAVSSGGTFTAKQFVANTGTACTNGELALSAGWQSTGSATVTAVAGTGQACSWTITTGTTTAANPTITDTLTNALPTATSVCWMNIYGGTHTAVAGESLRQTTLSATAPIFTANFTPTAAGTTYFVTRVCGP